MGLVDYEIKARSRCRGEHLPKTKRGTGRGDGQRGLTARCHPYWLCLIIFAVPPEWDGRFCCGSQHIWAPSPGLWGGSQQTANLELSRCGTYESHLLPAAGCLCVDGVLNSTEFPTLEKGYFALVPVCSHLLRGDSVTLCFSQACCEGEEKLIVFFGSSDVFIYYFYY